ncbi:hypothetical protein D3C79_1115110 [compost metagenome]
MSAQLKGAAEFFDATGTMVLVAIEVMKYRSSLSGCRALGLARVLAYLNRCASDPAEVAQWA